MQFRPFYCTQNQLNSSTESIAQAGRLIICTDSKSIYFCPSDGIATLVGKANDVTASEAGLMTPGMFSKLNGIADKATANTASSTTPKAAGNAAAGSETNYARGDHVHPLQTNISGNAGSATKVNNAITFTNTTTNASASGITFDGSTARTISYTTIGAAASSHTHTISNVTDLQSSLDSKLNANQKGGASGVAPLDSNRKVPIEYLPSYVSDVFEYASKTAFPTTGESNKIYVAKDTNLTYRWSGSAYVEISPSLALGITSSTAFAGDKGNTLWTSYGTSVTKGSTTQPVYIEKGVPKVIGYTISKSVPSDAVFTDSHYESKNVVGSSKATSNTTSALTNGNVYLNSVENGSVTSAHKISGTGATTVTTDASGNIIINSTNTTYNSMTGATASTAGSSGLVPAPAIGNRGQFLKGDGTWATPTDTNTWNANALNVAGYVAAPTSSTANKVWKTDASGNPAWRDDADTRYSTMGAASASAAGSSGLVPAPAAGKQTSFLRGDGTWVIPVSPYTSSPIANGTAFAGSSALYARGDHVHPALEWETF